MLLCEKYMKDNKRVYEKTFLEGYTKQQASKRFAEVFSKENHKKYIGKLFSEK